jgi:penicillin-binding protein activator
MPMEHSRSCPARRVRRTFAILLRLWLPALLLPLLLGIAGCGGRKVTRVNPDTTVDLSGRWNDADSREVSQTMIQDVLSHPWIQEWMSTSGGKKPTVIVGVVRNNTAEHIPVGTFVGDVERALVNSGRVLVVATAAERSDLRTERQDQWQNATEETAKKMGRELGADFMLGGTIESTVDSEGRQKVVFYQVDLNLVNIESNQKVWMDQQKIKKIVSQSRFAP